MLKKLTQEKKIKQDLQRYTLAVSKIQNVSVKQQFETYLFLKIRVMNINNRQIPHRVSPKRSHPC